MKREGEQPAGPRQHLIRGGNMASAPSLLPSVDGLSPHGEKQLLSTFSFCFFNSALMKKVLEKASDWPGLCWMPTTNSTSCGRDRHRVVEGNGSQLRKPYGWSGNRSSYLKGGVLAKTS